MSGTMDTTNRLLEYLRMLQTNPAAASYGGLPTEAQLVAPGSAPAPALPPQPARPTATVVSTSDETLPLPPQFMSPEEASGSGSPVVSPSLASRTPSESSSPFAISREEQQALDRLMAFGAALASAEGKSSVAAAGDAFQALARQGAAQRQEGRQERELDINAAYREAQMEVARAEQAARENPDSPTNMARLLSARADMMRAEAAMANVGAAASRERLGPGVPGTRDGQAGMYYPQVDRWVPYAPGFQPQRSADAEARAALTEDQRYLSARAAAERSITNDFRRSMLQGDARERAIMEETQRILRGRPSQTNQSSLPPAPTAPAGDLYDPLGRPIR